MGKECDAQNTHYTEMSAFFLYAPECDGAQGQRFSGLSLIEIQPSTRAPPHTHAIRSLRCPVLSVPPSQGLSVRPHHSPEQREGSEAPLSRLQQTPLPSVPTLRALLGTASANTVSAPIGPLAWAGTNVSTSPHGTSIFLSAGACWRRDT